MIVESNGIWLHFFESNSLVAYVPLRDVRHCIWQLSNALIGVFRTGSHGSPVPEQGIEFCHQGYGALWLSYDIPLGSDARLVFRDYAMRSVAGWHDGRARYRVVHRATATPRELADMFHLMLRVLARSRMADIMDTDSLLLNRIAEALRIYETEVGAIGNGRHQQQTFPESRTGAILIPE